LTNPEEISGDGSDGPTSAENRGTCPKEIDAYPGAKNKGPGDVSSLTIAKNKRFTGDSARARDPEEQASWRECHMGDIAANRLNSTAEERVGTSRLPRYDEGS
jgi:hypothetical protein